MPESPEKFWSVENPEDQEIRDILDVYKRLPADYQETMQSLESLEYSVTKEFFEEQGKLPQGVNKGEEYLDLSTRHLFWGHFDERNGSLRSTEEAIREDWRRRELSEKLGSTRDEKSVELYLKLIQRRANDFKLFEPVYRRALENNKELMEKAAQYHAQFLKLVEKLREQELKEAKEREMPR